MKLYNIEFDNISFDRKYWVDAFITYAEHEDGTPLTDDELDAIDSDTTYEYLIDYME